MSVLVASPTRWNSGIKLAHVNNNQLSFYPRYTWAGKFIDLSGKYMNIGRLSLKFYKLCTVFLFFFIVNSLDVFVINMWAHFISTNPPVEVLFTVVQWSDEISLGQINIKRELCIKLRNAAWCTRIVFLSISNLNKFECCF